MEQIRQNRVTERENGQGNQSTRRAVHTSERRCAGRGGMRIFAAAAGLSLLFAAGAAGSAQAEILRSDKNYAEVNTELYNGPGSLGGTVTPRLSNVGDEREFSGGELRVLSNQGSISQQLSAVMKSSDGKIVVVDGGVAEDAEHLLSVIREMGGYVDAWLITHPQSDHVGALYQILTQHAGEIDIRNIYYHFHEMEWYQRVDAAESGMTWVLNEALNALPADRVHGTLAMGDVIRLSDDMDIRVLNDPQKIEDAYAVNNSGLMYDVRLNGKHIIFLGDMGPAAGDQLLAAGVLNGITADFVQMSHHGQNGVSEAFYQALAPRNCIWPTPEWLYDSQKNNPYGFSTLETRGWIDRLSSVEHNYCTKDGDVRIL